MNDEETKQKDEFRKKSNILQSPSPWVGEGGHTGQGGMKSENHFPSSTLDLVSESLEF